MTLEILPRRFPHPRPSHRPFRRRIIGTFPSPPVYYYPDAQVIEVEAWPWRVTTVNSWGETVQLKSRSQEAALRFFKAFALCPKNVGFNVNLNLQHWTGSEYKTDLTRNSQSEVGKKGCQPLSPPARGWR